ncbi:MAG: hypothetical protein EOO10_11480, partial [Chitinophagaceae bacterium]
MELADHFLDRQAFCEHHDWIFRNYRTTLPVGKSFEPLYFKGDKDKCCFEVLPDGRINNSYFIGVDWLITGKKAVYVEPKVNTAGQQLAYLQMLFSALQHAELLEHSTELFEIKWKDPAVPISQQQDLLTPLLVVQFLQAVKNIVHKGLKKSYYRVQQTLSGRVKGKILVAETLKHSHSKGRYLQTHCSFDVFGVDGKENRLLKKALVFVQRYLPSHKNLNGERFFQETFQYVMPAFEGVSETVSLEEVTTLVTNPFYKEYKLAIYLAKLILRRFGYAVNNASAQQVTTPPFWIDMSKLFELYVLGLLKDRYPHTGAITYHPSTYGNELDFLINVDGLQMVADAKYKLKYQSNNPNHDDIRQVSGYSRLKVVY